MSRIGMVSDWGTSGTANWSLLVCQLLFFSESISFHGVDQRDCSVVEATSSLTEVLLTRMEQPANSLHPLRSIVDKTWNVLGLGTCRTSAGSRGCPSLRSVRRRCKSVSHADGHVLPREGHHRQVPLCVTQDSGP